MINLDTAELKTEETGQKIIQKLQEWLLQKSSGDMVAILPEDKIQRLLVGVIITRCYKYRQAVVNYYYDIQN